MIKESTRKIHFVAADIRKGRERDTSAAPTITISKGSMIFNGRLISELNLNGKFVRFYADSGKNILGFTVKEKADLYDLKQWKLVRQNPTSKMWTVSVKKILSKFGSDMADNKYFALPVQKYVERTDPLTRGTTYYFVEVKEKVDDLEDSE